MKSRSTSRSSLAARTRKLIAPSCRLPFFRLQTRRSFLKTSSLATFTAATTLSGELQPRPGYVSESNTIKLALIGCGGRGSGAVANAIEAAVGPVKLVAMADLFADRLQTSLQTLSRIFGRAIDVPPERQFMGLNAYEQAINCLGPGDVAILSTHAAFRAAHLTYAVKKGIHVFMEKSFSPDAPGLREIIALGEEAEKKNLKIATGLMCRHSTARQELITRIENRELGEIQLVRASRLDAGDRMGPVPGKENELHWQIRHPYFFFWVSTGRFIDYLIHQVDECCWILDSWPETAHGLGGRAPHSEDCGQNLDSYAVEFTFVNGAKAVVNGRFIPGCDVDFSTFIHGSRRAAQFSGNVHAPITAIYGERRIDAKNIIWRPAKEEVSPYVAEWKALLTAIRNDTKHNETRRSAYANLAAIMARAAVHTGKTVTWDQAYNSNFRFCPSISELRDAGPAPVRGDASGHYPVPVPGEWVEL